MSPDVNASAQRLSDRMVSRARQCVDELGAAAGDAWALWDELRRARTPPEAASPEEVLALGEYIRADARVVGATRLASALGIALSDAYDQPDELVLPLGISPTVARERAADGARRRARHGGAWRGRGGAR